MPRKQQATDAFMNWAVIPGKTHPTVGTTLQETKVHTGLSIRGALVWLIHLVQIYSELPIASALTGFNWALCTVSDLAVLPNLQDKGVIAAGRELLVFATSGATYIVHPHTQGFLPPIPIAAPSLSLYVTANQDVSGSRDGDIPFRIGFTTAPLDTAMYAEIAETWGY